MNILDQIEKDFSKAVKEKNMPVVNILRLFKAGIIIKEKEGKEVTEEIVLNVLNNQIKKLKESIDIYKKADRQDLVDKEQEQLNILLKYLPEQLSDEEIAKKVDQVLDSLDQSAKSNFGQVMGAVMKELKGKADGGVVRKVIEEKIRSNNENE